MKRFLFFVSFVGLTSCGNGGPGESSSATSATLDSGSTGTVRLDTSANTIMNVDTTGMGNAR